MAVLQKITVGFQVRGPNNTLDAVVSVACNIPGCTGRASIRVWMGNFQWDIGSNAFGGYLRQNGLTPVDITSHYNGACIDCGTQIALTSRSVGKIVQEADDFAAQRIQSNRVLSKT
ncbi:MAG TPA: hypothetical protein VJC15_01680 [Candidatus Paceibacterota bacterium]